MYQGIYMALMIKLLSKLEINGIKVDEAYLKKLSKKFEERLKKIEKEIYSISMRGIHSVSLRDISSKSIFEKNLFNL